MDPLIIETHENEDAWRAARKTGHRVSASVAGAILSLSPHKRPWDEWAERKRPDLVAEHDAATLKAFAQGHAAEDFALRLLAIDTGETITTWPQRSIAVADGVEWLTCTPDATDESGEPIEAKYWRGFVAWPADGDLALSDEFPRLDWIAQLAIQIAILGKERGRLIVLDNRGALHVYRVAVDADTVAALVSRLRDWRDAHLVGDAEPPMDPVSDAWRMSITHAPKPGGENVEADDSTADLCRRYAAAKRAVKAAEDALEPVAAEMLAAAANVPGFTCPDGGVVSWTQRKASEGIAGLKQIAIGAPDLLPVLRERNLIRTTPATRHLTARGFSEVSDE